MVEKDGEPLYRLRGWNKVKRAKRRRAKKGTGSMEAIKEMRV